MPAGGNFSIYLVCLLWEWHDNPGIAKMKNLSGQMYLCPSRNACIVTAKWYMDNSKVWTSRISYYVNARGGNTITTHSKHPGPVFSYKLRYIVGFWLVEMAISTNQKPTIYRNLYKNTCPVNTTHLYNIYTMLVQHCINVIQMFCVYWDSFWGGGGGSSANKRYRIFWYMNMIKWQQ